MIVNGFYPLALAGFYIIGYHIDIKSKGGNRYEKKV